MELTKPFAFIDHKGKKWSVPAGTIVDGASIPRFLWAAVGSPFTGEYRNASVVHDYYCEEKNEKWEDVHLMFYEGCITGGVSQIKAKVMYAAVYAQGPRWKLIKKCKTCAVPIGYIPIATETDSVAFNKEIEWIKKNNPSLNAIKRRMKSVVKEVEE